MDFYFWLFVIVSLSVIIDWGYSGLMILSIAKGANHRRERAFVRGMGHLLVTMAILNAFWLALITVASAGAEFGPIYRAIMALLFSAIGIGAIIGRRIWWRTIKPTINQQIAESKKDEPI